MLEVCWKAFAVVEADTTVGETLFSPALTTAVSLALVPRILSLEEDGGRVML